VTRIREEAHVDREEAAHPRGDAVSGPDGPGSLLPLTHITYHVLLSLAEAPLHGYGILKAMEERSRGRVSPSTGSLYLALQRMAEEGLIEEAPSPGGEAEEDSRRRYYRLTALGREVARAETDRLRELLGAAARAGLAAAGSGGGSGGGE